jgi:NADPH:quinone reductase-like Zn-dependent oxidoreductase
VKVLIDESVPEASREKVEKLVVATIGDRADSDTLVVSIVRMSPGRGWDVFINDVQDPPLVDAIQKALKKGGF